jgi:membrane protein
LASALTFDALLAAVPFLLLLLIGLSHLAQAVGAIPALAGGPVDPAEYFHRFLPPHAVAPGTDPFAPVESLLVQITKNRGEISILAAPAFVWFSTRLYASVRTALNEVYDVTARPLPVRHPIIGFLRGKARDAIMVVVAVSLFLMNTLLTGGLAYLQSRGMAVAPEFRFFVTNLGRLLGELLAFSLQLSLFFVTYRYASVRRLPWRTAMLAAVFTSLAFELAKRLYGLYLANFASLQGPSGNATLGTIGLFVLWVYYTALVFLLGGVVAETWELRKMQQRQRMILG